MSDNTDFLGEGNASKNPSIQTKDQEQNRDEMRVGGDAVKGAFSKKGLFNPANRKRMIFFGVSGFLLFSALTYTFMSAAPEAPGGDGEIGRVYQSGVRDGSDDPRVQESIRQYNKERLPEVQRDDPFAHPLLMASEELEDEPDAEPLEPMPEEPMPEEPLVENPFEEPEEEVVQEGQQQRRRNLSEEDVKRAMNLMDKLVRAELEQPQPMSVAWNYAQPNRGVLAPDGESDTDSAGVDDEPMVCEYRRVRAGTTLFGTTDLALNSDVGGSVSVTIRSGVLNGYRMLGQFERKDKWLRIVLDRLVAKDEVVSIDAIALDMDTTLNAVSGDVNRHIMYRYGWWGVGAVLKGLGKAAELSSRGDVIYSEGGHVVQSTNTTTKKEVKIALGELGEDMGDEAKKRLNRPITVSLDRNEQIGVFILDDICVQ